MCKLTYLSTIVKIVAQIETQFKKRVKCVALTYSLMGYTDFLVNIIRSAPSGKEVEALQCGVIKE